MDVQHALQTARAHLTNGLPRNAQQVLWGLIEHLATPREARAAAFVMLAESYYTRAEQRACYGEALQLMPAHPEALAGINRLSQPPSPNTQTLRPPPPPPSAPRPQLIPYYRVVGISDGPNSAGSGFFISPDGIIATTRHVVAHCTHVTVKLDDAQHVQGTVLWSSPTLDLAFIETPYTVLSLSAHSQTVLVPHQPLTAYAYGQTQQTLAHVPNGLPLGAGWFSTTLTELWDAGGSPIFSAANAIVGMITRNCSRLQPHVYALSIQTILEALRRVQAETAEGLPRRYCPSCGQRPWADMARKLCPCCGASFSEDWLIR
jgi:hypothetical protein